MNILERIYYMGYRLSRMYKTARQKILGSPVISVGNLTLGGTGKTPAVIALAQEAVKRGFKPCILTRGYKGRIKNPVVVTRGNGPLHGPEDVGDEAFLIADRVKGVEIVKAANRYQGGLLSSHANLFILDDGYQHWKLGRDRNILLIDGLDPFGNRRLFPTGKLREPLSEMQRADTIVITRVFGDQDRLINEVRTYNNHAAFYLSAVKPSWLVRNNGEILPVSNLQRKKVYAFCGLGNPSSFIQTILHFGTSLVGFQSFRDHHSYKDKEIDKIWRDARRLKADWVVMTEKDLVKLKKTELPENFVALRIEFFIDDSFYDSIFNFKSDHKDQQEGEG